LANSCWAMNPCCVRLIRLGVVDVLASMRDRAGHSARHPRKRLVWAAMAEAAAKLQIKPGHRVLVLNGPSGGARLLGPLPKGAAMTTAASGRADAVLLFVRDSTDLQKHAGQAARAASGDRILWIAYPKKTSGVKTDLSRDVFAGLLRGHGVQPVSQVAIDDTWSALRLRPLEASR
jgi:hypothetical protein